MHLWQRNRSTLLQCRRDLADKLRKDYPQNYETKSLLSIDQVTADMASYRDLLYGLRYVRVWAPRCLDHAGVCVV